ncbi:hypothetical protein NDU88_001270 [Pleurodeles waltl]|uniref:Uncharacterized protein n=1 Tax=Pleurodeles waltl TaxID=8319 RepID=A0AAV7WM64_PLEWA|nr:hypothetical protein NDU88_001270 [Pleurodeles waltl]
MDSRGAERGWRRERKAEDRSSGKESTEEGGRGHEAEDGARLIRLLRRGPNFSCYPGPPPPGQIDGERERGPVWVTRAPAEPRASLAEHLGGGRRAPRPGACRRVGAGSRSERARGGAWDRAPFEGSRLTAAGKAGRPPSCLEVPGERRDSCGGDRGKPCAPATAEDSVTAAWAACGPSAPILASKRKQQERARPEPLGLVEDPAAGSLARALNLHAARCG